MQPNVDGLIALTPSADHTSKVGYFVNTTATTATICSAVTDLPVGVIVDGEDTTGKSTIAVAGAVRGFVKVKLTGTLAINAYGYLKSDGSVGPLPGSAGTYTRVCRVMKAGVSGDIVPAVLCDGFETTTVS